MYMVLGYILYEGADLAYHLGKITYDVARCTYYWYLGTDYPEVAEEKRSVNNMEELNERIEELETLLKYKQKDNLDDA